MGLLRQIIDFLGSQSIPVITAGATYGVFRFIESIASPNAKIDLARWLLSFDVRNADILPRGVIDTFNRIFGKDHFSITCFIRSIYFTIGAIVLTALIYLLVRPDTAFRTKSPENQSLFFVIASTWLLLSVFYDYLNLLKTRLILEFLTKHAKSRLTALVLLILDPVLAYVAFAVFFSLLGLVDILFLYPDRIHEALVDAQNWPAEDIHLIVQVVQWQLNVSPIFYAGMLPSMWLWIFILASFLTRLLVRGEPIVKILRYSLDIEKKPFRIAGALATVLVFAISALILGISYAINPTGL
jgi:hypothetical protein